MNVKRNVAIALAAGAGAAWFAAATPAIPPRDIPAAPAAIDKTGAALQHEVDRLHERLRPDAAPRAAVRNPFAFHRTARDAARAPSIAAASVDSSAPTASTPVEPPLTLSGLAEDAGAVRTAILSASGQVFLVHDGDTLTIGTVSYVVNSVTANGVELRNVADGAIRRLRLP